MSEKKFRYVLLILILILSGWNVYNTKVINDLSSNSVPGVQSDQPIQYLTYSNTDFTKIAESNLEKTVGVTSYNRGVTIGTGSGVIYQVNNKEVLIVTNNHVISNAEKVSILFANMEEVEATVLGADIYSDLAVLKVEVDFSVEAFVFGDSSTLKVGEWVLAIGSPLGHQYSGSVTPGIISGKDRNLAVDLNSDGIDDWDMVVLQTSAAINPGNSGGPLINMSGQLIGINSMKISDESVEGMAFAIPINEAIEIVEQLITSGKVVRPQFGVSGVGVNDIPTYLRSYYDISLSVENGVFAAEILKGSPADTAGLKEGDIILTFDGKELSSFKEFRVLLYNKEPGDEVVITYIRGTAEHTATVTLK